VWIGRHDAQPQLYRGCAVIGLNHHVSDRNPDADRDRALTATQDGLSLTASLARTSVESGGKLTIDITVHNGRTSPIGFIGSCDGFVELTTSLPLPLEPAGRTWTGAEADLKADPLGKGSVPGESNDATEPISTGWCNGYDQQQSMYDIAMTLLTFRPGQTVTSTLVWSAELVSGVPALPGVVPFTIWLVGPPAYSPTPTERVDIGGALRRATSDQLQVAGNIHTVGQGPKLLRKGQVVDAALANAAFTKWLAEQT